MKPTHPLPSGAAAREDAFRLGGIILSSIRSLVLQIILESLDYIAPTVHCSLGKVSPFQVIEFALYANLRTRQSPEK